MKVWIKRTLLVLGVLLLLVATLAVFRAVTVDQIERDVEAVEVQIDYDGVVERLSEAIRFATISPVSPDDDVTAFVELRQRIAEFYPTFHDVAERRIVNDLTLHFIIEGSEPDLPHVVFMAHQDVVPVEEGTEADWEHPPFSGAVSDGFVWGRGTLDNKQNMLAILEAAEQWLVQGGGPRHTIHFVFGHDEEIGGQLGARAVAQNMLSEDIDVIAVFDEGLVIVEGLVPGVDEPVALVGVAERGYLSVEISAFAGGGHSSMPPEDLAVVRLARALDRLDENPMRAGLDGPTEQMFEAVLPEMNFVHRLIFGNLWLFRPIVLSQMTSKPSTNAVVRTTAAPTMLRASNRDNVLPQRAVATVNFRIHPRDSIDGVMTYLEALLDEDYYQIEMTGEMRSEPSPVASLESQGFRALESALLNVYPGIAMAPNMLVGAADGRHFTELTSDIYRFSPIPVTGDDLERIHGTNERIAVEAYHGLIHYWAQLLRRW